MVAVHFERATQSAKRQRSGTRLRKWLKRASAFIMLPFMLGLMMIRPDWFGPEE